MTSVNRPEDAHDKTLAIQFINKELSSLSCEQNNEKKKNQSQK